MKRRKVGHNKLELRALAMRRSGHHAILNWICLHFKNRVCWINNVSEYSFRFDTIWTYSNLKHYGKWWKRFQLASNSDVFMTKSKYDIVRDDKRCLLHSYEDADIDTMQEVFTRQNNGRSERIVTLIVVRDPYNQTASRAIRGKNHNPDGIANIGVGKNRSRTQYFDMMKQYYRECLGETDILKGEKLVLNYNKWVQSIDYRKSISTALGLEFTDRGRECVVNIGRGSSFEKMSKHGAASSMDVLNRWKRAKHREIMDAVYADKELARLSAALFGKVLDH